MADAGEQQFEKLGQGRSAEVFVDRSENGQNVVHKIFLGEGLAKLVLYVLTGSANPYTWCEAAIRAAVARRRILTPLVAYWFDGNLRLPRTDGWEWNEEYQAFVILSELIEGSHAPLRGPQVEHPIDPVKDLLKNVMKPLQLRLVEAGFDGLVWQAGRGNPVAANNFMLETPVEDLEAKTLEWVWIDLESGVPALFALNPLATLGYYLPKSFHHGRWLFDDVDVAKLRRYLEEHQGDLSRKVGSEALAEIHEAVEELDSCQETWRAIPRHGRSIHYEQSRGRLSEEEATYYHPRPLRWNLRMAVETSRRAVRWTRTKVSKALAWCLGLHFLALFAGCWHFAVSQRYRAHLARLLGTARIQSWSDRRFLDAAEEKLLHSQMQHDEVSSYVTDFGVHIMIKPLIKAIQYLVVIPLATAGTIDPLPGVLLLIFGGPAARTIYTLGRLLQAAHQGQRLPWVALAVGTVPMMGNVAYPTQLLYCSTEQTGEVARFIFYDSLAAIGRAVPVWGGSDSLVEHFFNRMGDVVVHVLMKPIR
jgi:hypothetical protein